MNIKVKNIKRGIGWFSIISLLVMLFDVSPFCKTAQAYVGQFDYNGVIYQRSNPNELFCAVNFESEEECPALLIPPSLKNPSTNEQYVIGSIAANAFYNKSFQSIKLHTSKESKYIIDENAFQYASCIGDFGINGDIDKIAFCAFKDFSCNGEFKVVGCIGDIRIRAFENFKCEKWSLENMTCKNIRERAFAGSTLTSFHISELTETIESKAFYECTDMTTLILPSADCALDNVADDAFPDNEGMTVQVPAGWNSLSVFHFENYKNIIFEINSTYTAESSVYQQLYAMGAKFRIEGNQDLEPIPTPSASPTVEPTQNTDLTPTVEPTEGQTQIPNASASSQPTVGQSQFPNMSVSSQPTVGQTQNPDSPSTSQPTAEQSQNPDSSPTSQPTAGQSQNPVSSPTLQPTAGQSQNPDLKPTKKPTQSSTPKPTKKPTESTTQKTTSKIKKNGLLYKINGKKQVICVGAISKKIKSVTIPKSVRHNKTTYKVTMISKKAFYNMKKLKKVTIGDNVKIIGVSAFEKCVALEKISFGKSVTKIQKRAFYLDTKIRLLDFCGTKLNAVGKKAFSKGKRKKTVLLPNGAPKKKYYRLLQNAVNQ